MAVFPHELSHVPCVIAERETNLVHWTRFDRAATSPPPRNPT